MIALPELQLGYQFIPKVGTTSLFTFFYTCVHGVDYDPMRQGRDGRPVFVHRYFIGGDCPDARDVDNSAAAVADYGGYYRFALTRDPVRRFLSMYVNRVIQKRELAANSPYAQAIMHAGLPFDPDINLLVRHLEAYLDCHASLLHHARPMMDFLGPDLSVYDRIADLSAMNTVVEEIKAHWCRVGMAARAATATLPGKMQRCGVRLDLECLTPRSFERLLDYYHADYAELPTVSLPEIKAAYARVAMGAAQIPPSSAARQAVPAAVTIGR
jgi:hypothetical protein